MNDDSPEPTGRDSGEALPQETAPVTPEHDEAGTASVEHRPSSLSELLSQPIDRSGEPLLNGTWEKAGRHPAAAASVGMLGIGLTYFYGQGILTTLVLLASGNLPGFESRHDSVFNMQA